MSVALLMMGAQVDAAPPDAHEEDVPVEIAPPRQEIQVGERLAFEGRWFGIPVGGGWIEVTALTALDGRPAYQIDGAGFSNKFLSRFYPIHDSIRSYLDAETLRPLRFEKDQREGHYRSHEIVTFDYDKQVATYRSLLNGTIKHLPFEPGVQDLISAFYWMRRQPITVGVSMHVDIYSDEKIFPTEIVPLRAILLELLWRGSFPAVLIEPKAQFKGVFVKRARIEAYFSADARRIPLLVKVWTPWGLMTGIIDAESARGSEMPSSP